MGLRQIPDDSTDTATSDDAGDTVTPDISLTPEEIVLRRLRATAEERVIERATISQHLNVNWSDVDARLQARRNDIVERAIHPPTNLAKARCRGKTRPKALVIINVIVFLYMSKYVVGVRYVS